MARASVPMAEIGVHNAWVTERERETREGDEVAAGHVLAWRAQSTTRAYVAA